MSASNNNKPTRISSSGLRKLSAKIKQTLGKSDPINIGKNCKSNGHVPKIGTFTEAQRIVSRVKFLLPGWIPYSYVTVVFSESGVGKSAFILYALANPVLTGCDWFNGAKGPKPSLVMWCDTEASTGLNLERINNWKLSCDKLITPFENPLDSLEIDNEDHIRHLEECIVYYKIKLVVIDTMRGSHSGEENSSKTAATMKALASIAERTGVAIVLAHHAKKLIPGTELTIQDCRGSTAIIAQARCVIGIDVPDKDSRWARMRMLKQNFGIYPDPVGFHVTGERVEFGEAPTVQVKTTEKNRAADWLRNRMKPGKTYKASLLIEEAEQEGFSKTTLMKACNLLQVKKIRIRADGHIVGCNWSLS